MRFHRRILNVVRGLGAVQARLRGVCKKKNV